MKYMKAMMETVELQAEDVVLTSSCADDEEECEEDFPELDCPTQL